MRIGLAVGDVASKKSDPNSLAGRATNRLVRSLHIAEDRKRATDDPPHCDFASAQFRSCVPSIVMMLCSSAGVYGSCIELPQDIEPMDIGRTVLPRRTA